MRDLTRSVTSSTLESDLKWVKRGIWLYLGLLLLEGSLRKWIFPGISSPLLLVRDPVVIAIYWAAYRSGRIKNTSLLGASVAAAFLIAVLAAVQVSAGITTLPVALYGWRSYALHLPLIAILGQALSPADVRKLGSWMLVVSIPMAVLMIFQYRAGSASWLNAGAGEGSTQIGSAAGHLRASGTFSFSTGAVSFLTLTFSFLLSGLTSRNLYSRKLLWCAALATLAAVPMAGSRTLLFSCAVMALLAPLAFLFNVNGMTRLIKVAISLSVLAVLLLQTRVVSDAIETMQSRWREASGSEGDVSELLHGRFLSTFTDAFSSLGSIHLLGSGVGMGSNVAAVVTTGSVQFLMGEGEWVRIVFEFGPIFGPAFLAAKVLLAITITVKGLRACAHSPLGWLLATSAIPLLLTGVMEQPTNLGFIVIGAGVSLAAAEPSKIIRRKSPQRAVNRLRQPDNRVNLNAAQHHGDNRWHRWASQKTS